MEKNELSAQASLILKDIELNHNWSWYREIHNRNKNDLDAIAIFYRGTKITYRELFENSIKFAKAMKSIGIKKNDEIPICMGNCPEIVYVLCAISMIGAKANIFGCDFNKEYITQIIDGCNSPILFASDNIYDQIKKSVDNSLCKKKVLISLTDSLLNHTDPYAEIDNRFYEFENKVWSFKKDDNTIVDKDEFIALGANYNDKLINNSMDLNDEFTITYSSGSTNSERPKAIVHTIRPYITMGRFHDKDASATRPMKNMTVLAQIPTHSNTNITSNISDTLMQGCTIALEPIYDKDFFLYSLLINKPNFITSTRSFWINAMKKLSLDSKIKLPFILAAFSVGESLSPGEEKFINRIFRKAKVGMNMLPFPISPLPISIAGGDCEHGGLFFNLFKKYNDMKPYYLLHKEQSGLRSFSMVEYAVLDEYGNKCAPYKIGRLVANSNCNMKCYKDDPMATKEFYIFDANGKKWADCSIYSYIDYYGSVHMKGRLLTIKDAIPPFVIADEILKDTKNIMSCEVIPFEDGQDIIYVAHIEPQPSSKMSNKDLLVSIESRIKANFPDNVVENVFYRLRDNNESFPLTSCGKRSNKDLMAEGISKKCIKPIFEENEVRIACYSDVTKSKCLKLKID